MAEIFPNEGLDLIYGGFPKGATGPANTWLGLFTSWTASTVAGSAATAASPSGSSASSGSIRLIPFCSNNSNSSGRRSGSNVFDPDG